MADPGNQFHYYRLSADNRILFGGYDAVYCFGKRVRSASSTGRDVAPLAGPLLRDVPAARRASVHPRLGGGDRHVHPVLRVLRARRTAAGSRTPPATPGSASAPRRFGADVMLDLLSGEETERTRLELRAHEADAVPAGAVRLRRHPAHPLVARPRPTTGRAGATCGCAGWTGSGSASTPSRETERRRCDPVMGRDHTADSSNSSGSLDLNATGTDR